ncbi:MAG: NifB/NifX family molybdenum-iron cluster-binding protein [Candidatus Sabulitectum sp.]|nr:NifB/NifX family molybdenum-iron cluster-binding protein [Candidatus Sabulitectum sp.]
MRLAITVWNGRIAPVFDVAGTLRLVEMDEGRVTADNLLSLPPGGGVFSRVSVLTGQRIDVLVCGAVSRPVHRMLTDSGIQVHSFVSGEAKEVLEAFLHGSFDEKAYFMPGCGVGRNRQGRRRGAGLSRRGRNRSFGPGWKEV